ncbi:hypothetical protein [Bernardetia sp.]|uniref:hypothetical protein n=1 Tax=Bernardetia sp. TaxID=1937974 RepID=UPI0025C5EE0F|nr:hypothetical protein [Bernardetia sp.]
MPVRKFGDFGKVNKVFENLNQNLIKAEKNILARIASKAEQLAVDRIKSQPSEWKRLSPAYLKRKLGGSWGRIRKDGKRDRRFKNRSEKILISSSTYINSITSNVSNSLVAYAGVPKNAKYDNGESVAKIAAIHEYGSTKRNIPARPVWLPVKNQVRNYILTSPEIPKEMKGALLRGVK